MFDSFPVLHTERLDLVEITDGHLQNIFELFGDYRVTKFYNVVTLKNESEAQKFIDWFRSRYIEKSGIRWGIALKGHQQTIGTIGFNNFTSNHRANIGYDLQADYWNQGFISEALKAIVDFGFRSLNINRVEAEVMQGNLASENVLIKTGFVREGVLREWLYWNEQHFDMTMFSLLQSDRAHPKGSPERHVDECA